MPKEGFVEEEGGLGNGSLVEMISARKGPKKKISSSFD